MKRPNACAIARIPGIPEALEKILLSQSDLHEALASNPTLHESSWLELYRKTGTKPVALTRASALAHRPLSATQIRHQLSQERRLGPILQMLWYNELDEDLLDELEALKFPASIWEQLARYQREASPQRRRGWTERAGGMTLLRDLAASSPEERSDAEIITLLASMPAWGPVRQYQDRTQVAGTLLADRPGLWSAYVTPGAHEALRSAAASSSLCEDPDHQRIIAGLVTTSEGPRIDENLELSGQRWVLWTLLKNLRLTLEVRAEIAEAVAAALASGRGNQIYEDPNSLGMVVSEQNWFQRNPVAPIQGPIEELRDPLALRTLASRYKRGRGPAGGDTLVRLLVNPHLDTWSKRDLTEYARYSVHVPSWSARRPLLEQWLRSLDAGEYRALGLDGVEISDAFGPREGFGILDRPAVQAAPELPEYTDGVASLDVFQLSWKAGPACAYLLTRWEQNGQPDAARWNLGLRLMDEMDGTIEELCTLVDDLVA